MAHAAVFHAYQNVVRENRSSVQLHRFEIARCVGARHAQGGYWLATRWLRCDERSCLRGIRRGGSDRMTSNEQLAHSIFVHEEKRSCFLWGGCSVPCAGGHNMCIQIRGYTREPTTLTTTPPTPTTPCQHAGQRHHYSGLGLLCVDWVSEGWLLCGRTFVRRLGVTYWTRHGKDERKKITAPA